MSSDFFHSVAIAGAGTGKTYSLVENYIDALLGCDASGEKKRPQEIIALTFTEKAASEMRLRITKRLAEIISDQARIAHYAVEPDELYRILRALPSATIATFHSFCSQLLRKEAMACGIDDRFTILSPREELAIARAIMRPIIIDEVENNNRAVKMLVARMGLSAHGTSLGLLDGLLETYGKLFEKNIDCNQLVKITAQKPKTLAMLNDQLEKVEHALQEFLSQTLSDKTRARLDHVASHVANFSHALHELHEASLARAFTNLRHAASGNFGSHQPRRNLVCAIATLGNGLVDFFAHEHEVALAQVMARFHEQFSQYKSQALVLSYSDLLYKTKEALSINPALRGRIKQRIKHILVDEYQDTSPIQQDIIALLAEDRGHEAALVKETPAILGVDFRHGSSLFIVGDKKQSIYGFRGANVALFDEMVAKMEETHAASDSFTKRILVTNRRSARRVIDLVNLVAHHTMQGQGYQREHALAALPAAGDGHCGLWVNEDDNGLDKTSANLKATVFGIVHILQSRKDIQAKDVVVLVRRIKSAIPMVQHLASFGIAARIIGGDGFYQQQEIVDLISALKLINDPSNQLVCGVVLRSPLVLLSDQDIMEISLTHEDGLTLANALSWCDAQTTPTESSLRLQSFCAILETLSCVIVKEGLAVGLDALIDGSDLAYCYGLHTNGEQKWANITKLRTKLMAIHHNPFSAIDELYDELFSQSKEAQATPALELDAVTIMTIHQSKGLEFKVVVLADGEGAPVSNYGDFLVSATDGLVMRPRSHGIGACASSTNDDAEPTRYERERRLRKAGEEQEIARLLYVALTRAKQEVYVACSQASYVAKTNQHSLVGCFLQALHADPDQFRAIVSIEHVRSPSKKALETSSALQRPAQRILKKPVDATRWFASALNLPEDSEIAELIVPITHAARTPIDGDFAHHLLGVIGPLLWRNYDESALDALLDASRRANGIADCHDYAATIAAVKVTMKGMRETIPKANWALCEMPLICSPGPNMVIEGFADFVVDSPDFIGVIEFKSSRMRAQHIATYGQVLAYAHALAEANTKEIRYAVGLVGSPQLRFQVYDDKTKSLFQRALGVL